MDKWYQKSYDRFESANYFDLLLRDPKSPYCQVGATYIVDNNDVELMISEAKNLNNSPEEIALFIMKWYDLKLTGDVFGDSQRFVRSIWHDPGKDNNKKPLNLIANQFLTPVLKKEPSCSKALFDQIKSFPLNSQKINILAANKNAIRTVGKKDQEYLFKELNNLSYVSVTCHRDFIKHPKSYLTDFYKKVLKKLRIERNSSKKIDAVVRNHNNIYVIENKFQAESGGAQGLSKKDAEEIFSYQNNSSSILKAIYCFDGNYSMIGNAIDSINDNCKIMSIFDVVEYIESGE